MQKELEKSAVHRGTLKGLLKGFLNEFLQKENLTKAFETPLKMCLVKAKIFIGSPNLRDFLETEAH